MSSTVSRSLPSSVRSSACSLGYPYGISHPEMHRIPSRGSVGSTVANVWPKVDANPTEVARRLSVEEWVALDEDVSGEFVGGQLVEEEVPDFTHELTVSWLLGLLRMWLSGRGFVVGKSLRGSPRKRDPTRPWLFRSLRHAPSP